MASRVSVRSVENTTTAGGPSNKPTSNRIPWMLNALPKGKASEAKAGCCKAPHLAERRNTPAKAQPGGGAIKAETHQEQSSDTPPQVAECSFHRAAAQGNRKGQTAELHQLRGGVQGHAHRIASFATKPPVYEPRLEAHQHVRDEEEGNQLDGGRVHHLEAEPLGKRCGLYRDECEQSNAQRDEKEQEPGALEERQRSGPVARPAAHTHLPAGRAGEAAVADGQVGRNGGQHEPFAVELGAPKPQQQRNLRKADEDLHRLRVPLRAQALGEAR